MLLVRKEISLHIVSYIFSTGSTKLQEGHVKLYSRLISEGAYSRLSQNFAF
jgi:hypothetical protein